MKLLRIVFIFFALGVFAFGIFMVGGSFLFFIDPASLLLVLVPALLISMVSYTPAEIVGYIALSSGNTNASAVEYRKALVFFNSFRNNLVLSSIAAVFIGTILILSNIRDTSVVGSGFAVTLLSILYAVLLIMIVILPFKTSLEKKLCEFECHSDDK